MNKRANHTTTSRNNHSTTSRKLPVDLIPYAKAHRDQKLINSGEFHFLAQLGEMLAITELTPDFSAVITGKKKKINFDFDPSMTGDELAYAYHYHQILHEVAEEERQGIYNDLLTVFRGASKHILGIYLEKLNEPATRILRRKEAQQKARVDEYNRKNHEANKGVAVPPDNTTSSLHQLTPPNDSTKSTHGVSVPPTGDAHDEVEELVVDRTKKWNKRMAGVAVPPNKKTRKKSTVIANDEPAADSKADVSTKETVEQSDFAPVDITGKTAGIVSRKRVNKYGEVMTPQWLIDKMIESDEWKRDEDDTKLPSDMFASCLELGFGQGGFLLTTLKAKIKDMEARFDLSKNNAEARTTYRRGLLWILTTIYGIEIQQDNVDYTRERMLDVMKEAYVSYYRINNDPWKGLKHFIDNANAIIEHNLIQGNALAMVDTNGNMCRKVTYQPVMTRNNKLVVITSVHSIPNQIGIHVSDFHGEPLIDGVQKCMLDKITAAFEIIDEELESKGERK